MENKNVNVESTYKNITTVPTVPEGHAAALKNVGW